MLPKQFTNQYVIAVHQDDLATAREIVAEVTGQSADQAFVPVPGHPGLSWASTVATPTIRSQVQSKLARLTQPAYYAWLDSRRNLAAQNGKPDTGRIDPKTGQISRGQRSQGRVNTRWTKADVFTAVDELLI